MNLARYHARSPRYVLSTDEDYLIRLAGPHQVPWEEGTQIQNVSLTGLAFTAPSDLCPLLGEVIKIQFTVPGSKQMACYAIVTRLDHVSKSTILVGVHFYRLEMPQRVVLAQGLSRKFKIRNETENRITTRQLMVLILKSIIMGITLFGITTLMSQKIDSIFKIFN